MNQKNRKVNLDTYVRETLKKNIKSEANINKFSRWRLLYKKSDKELKEALKVVGYREPEIVQFIYARKYFKQVYLISKVNNPNRKLSKKWPDPDKEDFIKSAECYNSEKKLSFVCDEVVVQLVKLDAKQIQNWMQICINALQNYPKSIIPRFLLDALAAEDKPIM